jgi:hypothetical protein
MSLAWKESARYPDRDPGRMDQFIHKIPPFMNFISADLQRIEPDLRQSLLHDVVVLSHRHDIPYLKTMMMRVAGDNTGLIGLLIGRSNSPKETLEALNEVGDNTLLYLKDKYRTDKDMVFNMFSGGQADWKSVPIANDLLLFALTQLKKDGITHAADTFLRENETALKELYANEGRKKRLLALHPDMHPKLLASGFPTIIYTEADGIVKQQYMLPSMPAENAEMLQKILPDPDEIPFIMNVINMGGHPLVRAWKETMEDLLKTKTPQFSKRESWLIRQDAVSELARRHSRTTRY